MALEMNPGVLLLPFFDQVAQAPNLPCGQRDDAAYIAALFRANGNVDRLFDQLIILLRGDRVIQIRPEVKEAVQKHAFKWYGKTVIQRYGSNLYAIMAEFDIIPTIADYEAQPISISSILALSFDSLLDINGNARLRQYLVQFDRTANRHLLQLAGQFGYHPIFRIGLLQCYLT